jgi:hypothetical protein
MNQKSIIVKEITTYHQTEQVEICYVSFPQRGIDKASMRNKNIEFAFAFNPKSSLLKFHPIENRNTIHINYGNGICKTEWIYVDKEPNDESFPKVRDLKDIKISVRFPKVIKDSNNEKIQDN